MFNCFFQVKKLKTENQQVVENVETGNLIMLMFLFLDLFLFCMIGSRHMKVGFLVHQLKNKKYKLLIIKL